MHSYEVLKEHIEVFCRKEYFCSCVWRVDEVLMLLKYLCHTFQISTASAHQCIAVQNAFTTVPLYEHKKAEQSHFYFLKAKYKSCVESKGVLFKRLSMIITDCTSCLVH